MELGQQDQSHPFESGDSPDSNVVSVSSEDIPWVLIITLKSNIVDNHLSFPSLDLQSYADPILCLAKLQKLQAQKSPPEHLDPRYDQIDKDSTTPVQLEMMPCPVNVAKGLWDKLSTVCPTSRWVESFYKIFDTM